MQAHKAEFKFIVQDKESALFLMPVEGDVGFTPWAHEAGRFDGIAEATDTAALNCHEGFFVTQVVCNGQASSAGPAVSGFFNR